MIPCKKYRIVEEAVRVVIGVLRSAPTQGLLIGMSGIGYELTPDETTVSDYK